MSTIAHKDMMTLCALAVAAGRDVLTVYNSAEHEVTFKEDASPLTEADRRSHRVIMDGLTRLTPDVPVLSEEGKEILLAEREAWTEFWLVDPLDGTKEFIKRNGEFTVNIALIDGQRPVLGVIYAPVPDILYAAQKGAGAYMVPEASSIMFDCAHSVWPETARCLPAAAHRSQVQVLGSRSHMSAETEGFVQELRDRHGDVDMMSAGSSLKFCRIAEGLADYYPRFAPTMEWDTGAGQIIVEESGGSVVCHDTREALRYNKNILTNPWFIATGATMDEPVSS